MFKDLKPYGDRIDSGAPWLGTIPAHWVVAAARSVFEEVGSPGHVDEPLLSVTISRGVLLQSELLASSGKRDSSNLDRSKYKLVEPGDIAYNKMRAWQGAFGLSQHRGIVSPAYVVVRPRRDCGLYLHHLLRTPGFAKEAERWSYGITSDQWSLRPEHFKMIALPVPPTAEQAAIVKYLAHAHRRIDRAIAAKRKLITLLEEQKQAIINQAVTRSIDSRLPLKDSGVPWLGTIPAHWRAARFKQVVGFQEGPGIMAADFRDVGIPLLRISCMAGHEVDLRGCNYLDPGAVEARWSKFRVRAGDYLLSASGSTGAVKPVGESAVGAVPYTGLIRLWQRTPDVDMEFVRLAMTAAPFASQIDQAKSGVGIEHFGPTHLKRMWIALPPIEEQVAIVADVAAATRSIDASAVAAGREVELLREFRVRLTSDVVTGQVDVRHLAATLPELDRKEVVDVSGTDDDLADEFDDMMQDIEA